MKTYKTQRTKTCLWHNMCRYWETNTRKIKPNIEKYIREQQLKYLLSTKNMRYVLYRTDVKEDDEETQIFFGLFVQILCRTYYRHQVDNAI